VEGNESSPEVESLAEDVVRVMEIDKAQLLREVEEIRREGRERRGLQPESPGN
jgi:hypothetical protein